MDVCILTSADIAALEHVADGVFDGPVVPALAAEFLADDRHCICVAIEDGLVVGFASAVRYVSSGQAIGDVDQRGWGISSFPATRGRKSHHVTPSC